MVAVAVRRRKGVMPGRARGWDKNQAEETWRILAAGVDDLDEILAELRALGNLWVEMVTHPGPLNIERVQAYSERVQRLANRGLDRGARRRLEALTGMRLVTERQKPAGKGGLPGAA